MKTINAIEMIKRYLKDNGYSGLYCEDQECGCSIEDIPQTEYCNLENCYPAYERKCKNCNDSGNCNLDAEGYSDGCFHPDPMN